VAGLLTLWSYILFESIPQRYQGTTLGSFTDTLEISAYLMLPVSFLSGLLFTFLGRAFFETWKEETRAVGLVTLANTLGATLGALLAGWALLPSLGIELSIFLLAVLYFAASVLPMPFKTWKLATSAFRASLVVILLAYLASTVLYPFGLMKNHFVPIVANRLSEGNASIIEYREGLTETIIFTQKSWMGEPYSKRLITNAFSMSGVDLPPIRYMKYFVYWPLAFHSNVKKAMLISYGVGSTAKALTDSKEIEQIDIVDISSDILAANSIVYPDPSELPLNDPRVTVFIEDGRFCLLTTDETYDLITAEPPPLLIAGVVNLYTQEYFELLRSRLNDGGFTTYWLPVGDLPLDDTKSVVRAFCSVFEDCSLWRGAEMDLIMVGSKNAHGPIDQQSFERQWKNPIVARELRILGIETPELLLSTFLGDASFLNGWVGEHLPLVDDYPHRLSGKEPDLSVYQGLLNNRDAQERYRNSSFLKNRLPTPLFEGGLAQYPYQAIIDYSLDVYSAPRRSLQLDELNLILTKTNLRTPVLWLLGDYTEFSGVIEGLVERNVAHEQVELYLGFREMADRNYGAAESHFGKAQTLGRGNINMHYYRILALAYAGDQKQAQELAQELRSKQGPTRNDSRFWEFCAKTFGISIS
jgi:spermidine synthase